MSQDVRTRPTESGDRESLDGLDGLDGGGSVSATDVLDRLWRFFISMRTGLVLILGLGLLSLIGTLLGPAPAGLAADPAGAWTSSVPISDNSPSPRISTSPVRIEMKKRQSRSRTSVAETEPPPSRPSRPSSDSRSPDSVGLS